MYAYIDESGDTGYTKKSSRYFILTSVIVDDPFVLRRIAKHVHKYNLNKKKTGTLHANSENDTVKNKLSKQVLNNNIKCIACIFDKQTVKAKDVYRHCLTVLAKHFAQNGVMNIVIARKDIRKSYNSKILEMYDAYGMQAYFSDPAREKALQISDFYSWAIFSNFEHDSPKYFLKLKDLIYIIKTKPSTGL